jgi:hypothetical protein
MNSDPAITVSINLKIQNQEFTLTQEEAYSIYNQLHKILGITWPITSPSYPTTNPIYPNWPTVSYTTSSSTPNLCNWKTC